MGNDKVVVCIRSEGKFQWSMLNGHSYGNYIDPALNCVDVVDNVPGAENGMYFIKTKKGPKQVWCDVTTAGGGFTLVGVKDTPETWAIPSSPAYVHPNGKSQWSSSLGEQAVLDFRIQILSSNNQNDTKANWMYRFNSARPLSSLLVKGRGGCSDHYPGIGDVAFVEDLQNNQIVNTKFQCSRFGSHTVDGLGWARMNSCLKKPCGKGFAYIFGFRYDSSGSFSFSVVSPKSGIRHNSTAFIGCDQGKCCACFGPKSDKDYCAPKCNAINGGTILQAKDGMRALFWIRSSLPKRLTRVWKKCMQYKRVGMSGKPEIWHVNEDGLNTKGPCSFSGEVRLNDGVAVVSNGKPMNRLPKVNGLLSYRIDNGKLYLQGNSQWQEMSTLKEVKKEISQVRNLINTKINAIISNKKVPKSVWIRSDGCDDPGRRDPCGLATIQVEGKDYSKRGRGYNVVVMNPKTGYVESSVSFDTYVNYRGANNLAKFLNSIGNRRIVLVAIQDEGSAKMTSSAYNALKRLGARNQYKNVFRSSFAFIGWSGPGTNSIVTQVQNLRYNGPSIIHKTIFVGA